MAESLLDDVFTKFRVFLEKKPIEGILIPVVIKRESYGAEKLSSIIFPTDLSVSQKTMLKQSVDRRRGRNYPTF